MRMVGMIALMILTISAATAAANPLTRLDNTETDVYTVQMDGKQYTLNDSVDRVTVVTDTHVVRVVNWDQMSVVLDHTGPMKTAGRVIALNRERFQDLWHDTVAPDMVTKEGTAPAPREDTLIQLGKKRWKVEGENPRFIAGNGNESTLVGYLIHWQDIARVLRYFGQTATREDSPYFHEPYERLGNQAFKMAEFLKIIYPDKKFGPGGFERNARNLKTNWVRRSGAAQHKNAELGSDGMKYIHRWNHFYINRVALGIVYLEMLQVSRTGKPENFKESYYAYYWHKFDPYNKGMTAGDLDTEEGLSRVLEGYGNMTRWGKWRVAQGLRRLRTTKFWRSWESGEKNIPLSPSVSGVSDAIDAELANWPETGKVLMDPASKPTTWGKLKKE